MLLVDLVAAARACQACPSMVGRRRVLSSTNGPARATLLFVAEAPGRLGAERTGVPLFGDRAGQHFEALLATAGLTREQVFITNSVLCNPQDAAGRNRSPAWSELRRCSGWLAAQIETVQPQIVATLGQVALAALRLIVPHEIVLARDVATLQPWNGRQVFPLYHPGFRARRYRSWPLQVADWQRLASTVQEHSTRACEVPRSPSRRTD